MPIEGTEMAVRVGKRALPANQFVEGTVKGSLEHVIERAAGGDVDAFRLLFERYGDRVRRYTRIKLGVPEDGDDALQDVFLAAWRGLPRFRYEHEGSFPGWLFGIARHVVAQHRRGRHRLAVVPLEEASEIEFEFEGNSVSRRVLVHELQRLPETQREALVLRFVVGLSVREVAVSMGKTEGAVMALQLRGLEHLRRRLRGAT
jgi:RNA polymerase sigma-70 factor (ECF subfamily)